MKERVYRFRAVERRIVEAQPGLRALDIGCGRGDNLTRLARYGGRPCGVDLNLERVTEARAIAPVAAARGEQLPWRDESFDLIYVSHVLHHASDVDLVLREIHRVLAPGGVLFLIETVDDSPLMRLARAIQPHWEGDDVLNRFRYGDLLRSVERTDFTMHRGAVFNWMYFAWELLPLAFRPLDLLSPVFIAVESFFSRWLGRWGGHCWLVAQKPGPSVVPGAPWEEPA